MPALLGIKLQGIQDLILLSGDTTRPCPLGGLLEQFNFFGSIRYCTPPLMHHDIDWIGDGLQALLR